MPTTDQPVAPQHHIERLRRRYLDGFHDDFLDRALHKIVQPQIAQDEANLSPITRVLQAFEQQYHLTSDEFWSRFQAGQMADTADNMEWYHPFSKMNLNTTPLAWMGFNRERASHLLHQLFHNEQPTR
ncbi:MAG: hypothetical protein HC884_00845 [Chloroflexaceae bacterium]|nr:hypothetical protein [Chloroflexaceae bacterium]